MEFSKNQNVTRMSRRERERILRIQGVIQGLQTKENNVLEFRRPGEIGAVATHAEIQPDPDFFPDAS